MTKKPETKNPETNQPAPAGDAAIGNLVRALTGSQRVVAPRPFQTTITPVGARINKATRSLVLAFENSANHNADVEVIFEGATDDPTDVQTKNVVLNAGSEEAQVAVPQFWIDNPGSRLVTIHIEIRGTKTTKTRHTLPVPAART